MLHLFDQTKLNEILQFNCFLFEYTSDARMAFISAGAVNDPWVGK